MIVRQGNRYLLSGPITFDSVGALVDEGIRFEDASVIIDLAGVTNADSSALSLLLEWMRHFRRSGRQIAFASPNRNLQSLAELYGVIDLIPFAAD